MRVITSYSIHYTKLYDNIIGSVIGDETYLVGDTDGAMRNYFGLASNGYIDNLNLSTEYKYNGGITKNYRIGANSIAIGAGNYEVDVSHYMAQVGTLSILFNSMTTVDFASLGDQRGP